MRIPIVAWVILFLTAIRAPAATPTVDIDARGMIRSLVDWPSEMPCRGGIWIVRDNWKAVQQQWNLQDLKHSPFEEKRTIKGSFKVDASEIDFHQEIDTNTLQYSLRPSTAIDVTGVYWFIELPVSDFAEGSVTIGEKAFQLAAAKPAAASIGSASASMIEIKSKDGTKRVVIRFPANQEIRVQDARVFGDDRYQFYTPLTETPLVANAELGLAATIETSLPHDTSPATITIDPKSTVSEFDGFGGNFVYAINDPTTQLSLDSLKLTWARIGIEAAKWEPTNDNDDPQITHLPAIASHDLPGSPLRERFELDQRLYKLAGGRVIASLWYPPEWLFAEPAAERNQPGTIPRERWDELAESIVSYLTHLKTDYGVEPALFSFNESDIGIYVLLSGDEMREMTKLLGKRLAHARLRTKILLGDSADLKTGLEQITPTLNDPDAMKFVGALAYHPWAGQNEQWSAWSDAAQKHGLMLMATEMGADATAWQDGSYNSPLATVRLAKKYVQQLRDAKTQVLLEWEWTGDYPMAETVDGKPTLTNRGRFLQQLTQTTPTQASVVEVKCANDSITAAVVFADDQTSAAIHLLNHGGDRTIHVRGIPKSLTLGTLFVIDPMKGEKTPAHIEAKDGGCDVDVPAGAIVTLAFPVIH